MIRLFPRAAVAGIAIVSLLACAVPALAQQTIPGTVPVPPQAQPPVLQQEAVAPAASNLVSDLSNLLIAGNRNEIEMSRLGQDRAQDPRVREFAERMIKEHQNFIDQVQQAASTIPAAAAPPSNLVQVLTDAGNRKLQLIQQDLSKRQGLEFDQAFMGNEIAAHIQMMAALQTAADHTTGQLRQVIDQGIQTTLDHLGHAKSVMQQLEQTAAQQAAQPKDTQQR